jgi:hypothetical protein
MGLSSCLEEQGITADVTTIGLKYKNEKHLPQKLSLRSMVCLQHVFNNVAEVASLTNEGFTEMTRGHSIGRLRECDVRISFPERLEAGEHEL